MQGSHRALEVHAGLAQARAAQDDLAYLELAVDQVVERHAEGDDVAPAVAGLDVDVVLVAQALERLALDEGHLPPRAGPLGIGAGLAEVAVPFEALAGHSLDRVDGHRRLARRGRDVDPDDFALPHLGRPPATPARG
jgi:hypothetical protein